MSASNKKSRKLGMESLEGRELMASDVTASVVGGVLNINGSAGNDRVTVLIGRGSTVVQDLVARTTVATVNNGSYSSVRVNMGNGTDQFELNGQNLKYVDNVIVNMGNGASEGVYIHDILLNNLALDASAAIGTGVTLGAVQVRNVASFEFGTDQARDWIGIRSGSSFNRLQANMGGGNDSITFDKTNVAVASINFGSGNDEIVASLSTGIGSGLIDGGSERNTARVRGASIRAQMRGFV